MIRRGHGWHCVWNDMFTVPISFVLHGVAVVVNRDKSPRGTCSLSSLRLTDRDFKTSPVDTSGSECPLDESSRPSQ